jgi:hypothetical protein
MAKSDAGLIRVAWRARESPLAPGAVAATRGAAVRLARRLLALPDADLRKLKGVTGPGLIVVLGEYHNLPWSPEVRYLGWVEGKNPLLLPTTHEPDVPIDLFEAALKRRCPNAHHPLVILPDAGIVSSTAEARPLCRETLRRWLSGGRP